MELQLFNFQLLQPVTLTGFKRWRLVRGNYADVIEIDQPWDPADFVPYTADGKAVKRLRKCMRKGLPEVLAVMRVLATLPAWRWDPQFELLYQTDPEAERSFDQPRWSQTNWYRTNKWGNLVPTAVDPEDCGCTECIIGEYIPLAYAPPGMMRDLVAGYIRNNTSQERWIEFEPADGGWRQTLAIEPW